MTRNVKGTDAIQSGELNERQFYGTADMKRQNTGVSVMSGSGSMMRSNAEGFTSELA